MTVFWIRVASSLSPLRLDESDQMPSINDRGSCRSISNQSKPEALYLEFHLDWQALLLHILFPRQI
jgi:hypothetical protein